MSRHMSFETGSMYRAVLLSRSSGINVQPKTYTMPDGSVIVYHRMDVHGPYTSKSSAKAAVTRESKYLKSYNRVDEVDAFVEEATTVWTVTA